MKFSRKISFKFLILFFVLFFSKNTSFTMQRLSREGRLKRTLSSDEVARDRVTVENPSRLLDSLAEYLLMALTGETRKSRNRLPKFVQFLFKLEDGLGLTKNSVLKINVPDNKRKFINGFCGKFKKKNISEIFLLLNKEIFSAKSVEDAKNNFKRSLELVIQSRPNSKWILELVEHLFNLREDENKKKLASYFFINFLSKVLLDFAHLVDSGGVPRYPVDTFNFTAYPFYSELVDQGEDKYVKNDIFDLALSSGYESALHLIDFEFDLASKYKRLIRHIFYYLEGYQELFFKGDNFDKLFKQIRSAEYLISVLKRDIDNISRPLSLQIYEQIKKKLEPLNFYPESYFTLVEIIYNYINNLGFDDFLTDKFLVKDTHLKKLVLEPKRSTSVNVWAPKGGHFDYEIPFILHEVPKTLHARTEVFEVINKEVITKNTQTGISFIDWIIKSRSSRFSHIKKVIGDKTEMKIEDIKYSTKSSTLFPDCYKTDFDNYINKLYHAVTDPIEQDGLEVFELKSNQSQIRSYVIKHKLSFTCSSDAFTNGEDPDSYIYVYFIMSKKWGLNLINTIFPLGAFVLDLDKIDSYEFFPIKYMDKIRADDTSLRPRYKKIEITKGFVRSVFENKKRNDSSKKMIIIGRDRRRYRLIAIRHGIYVKVPD